MFLYWPFLNIFRFGRKVSFTLFDPSPSACWKIYTTWKAKYRPVALFTEKEKSSGCTVGCPLKHKISHSKLLMGDMLCLYVGDPWKNFRFLSLFLTGCATHLWRGTILPCCNGKRAPGRPKISNFQKLAWYSPENRNAWTKCLPHHFGGCFARFFESVLRFGRSACHFRSARSPFPITTGQNRTPPQMCCASGQKLR